MPSSILSAGMQLLEILTLLFLDLAGAVAVSFIYAFLRTWTSVSGASSKAESRLWLGNDDFGMYMKNCSGAVSGGFCRKTMRPPNTVLCLLLLCLLLWLLRLLLSLLPLLPFLLPLLLSLLPLLLSLLPLLLLLLPLLLLLLPLLPQLLMLVLALPPPDRWEAGVNDGIHFDGNGGGVCEVVSLPIFLLALTMFPLKRKW